MPDDHDGAQENPPPRRSPALAWCETQSRDQDTWTRIIAQTVNRLRQGNLADELDSAVLPLTDQIEASIRGEQDDRSLDTPDWRPPHPEIDPDVDPASIEEYLTDLEFMMSQMPAIAENTVADARVAALLDEHLWSKSLESIFHMVDSINFVTNAQLRGRHWG